LEKRKRGNGEPDDASSSQWIEVTELPARRWTDDFKAHLHKLAAAGTIEDVREHHTETKVLF